MAAAVGPAARTRWPGRAGGVGLVPGPAVTAPCGVRLGHLLPGERPSDLNLLLVTLDTTRADRLGAYGFTAGDAESRPARARRRALRARRHARAPDAAGARLPLHRQVPAGHGVRDNGGFFLHEREKRWPSG